MSAAPVPLFLPLALLALVVAAGFAVALCLRALLRRVLPERAPAGMLALAAGFLVLALLAFYGLAWGVLAADAAGFVLGAIAFALFILASREGPDDAREPPQAPRDL